MKRLSIVLLLALAFTVVPAFGAPAGAETLTPPPSASSIETTVAAPPKFKQVPAYKGKQLKSVKAKFSKNKLTIKKRVDSVYSKSKKGTVISIKPTKSTIKYKLAYKTKKGWKARPGAKFIAKVSKGTRPYHWHSGIATWYSIADNTPAGSRETSTGRPLGSFKCNDPAHKHKSCYGVPFTFAVGKSGISTGDRILIKYKGKQHVAVATDTGGLETIDLYKPASEWFGMGGKSPFKYAKLGGHWYMYKK